MKRYSYLVHYSQKIEQIAKLPPSKLFESTGGSSKEWQKALADLFKKNEYFKGKTKNNDYKNLKDFGSEVFKTVFII
jgi:hypothetical protein